ATIISKVLLLGVCGKYAAFFAIIFLSREAHAATRGHSPENESNLRRALNNVASTLHVVHAKILVLFETNGM
ncbi:MAG: hypothetical protein IIT64_01860, partial [Bacteroidaceae bacterium]|nr:hypothetical protein [Bacteroidaceae bacterium]